MHIGVAARNNPDKIAIIDAESGVGLTFRDLDERSNRIAHFLRSLGLMRGARIAFMLPNSFAMFDIVHAALRAGLFVVPISTHLKAQEIACILRDSDCNVLFAAHALAPEAAVAKALAGLPYGYSVGGAIEGYESLENETARHSCAAIDDESTGQYFFYSSGSTGRPKGILRPLPTDSVDAMSVAEKSVVALWGFGSDTVYYHPSPMYHAAPLFHAVAAMALGSTFVMERQFDAERALAAIEHYAVTHTQWVPTMLIRMIKLPDPVRARYDLGSHRIAIHAAAPCPIDIKHRMIEWWGPILFEYYSATEANGYCLVTSEEWLTKPGTVGKALVGEIHIVDEAGNEVAANIPGAIYLGAGGAFEYHNDAEKTKASRHPSGWTTIGDMGYVDDDGYLFLTDRRDFMIISGGVNIYPVEAENVLHAHPEVTDVAVIGVPNEEFGEEVKAIVQLTDGQRASPEMAAELIRFCRDRIADVKCPRSIDFVNELPRLATGKLQKKLLRAPYWANVASATRPDA